MMRLVRAELFKLRTTNTWWLFAVATVVSTSVVLVVDCVNAHALLQPLDQYLALHSHGHDVANIPPEFLARITAEWTSGHDVVTQAATIFTSGQLIGVLLACLLGIVLITGEYHHQTATTTFVLTPRRTVVVASKLVTAMVVAALSWVVSTAISVIAGVAFLGSQGYGSQLDHWSVVRAVLLNLAAYGLWSVFGIGLGAVIRSQLAATVTATVLYLAGTAAAASVFELINTYVIKHDRVLTLQVLVPSVASAVMVSPTPTFTQSPSQWVGAAVLIGYGILAGVIGMSILRRRDVA